MKTCAGFLFLCLGCSSLYVASAVVHTLEAMPRAIDEAVKREAELTRHKLAQITAMQVAAALQVLDRRAGDALKSSNTQVDNLRRDVRDGFEGIRAAAEPLIANAAESEKAATALIEHYTKLPDRAAESIRPLWDTRSPSSLSIQSLALMGSARAMTAQGYRTARVVAEAAPAFIAHADGFVADADKIAGDVHETTAAAKDFVQRETRRPLKLRAPLSWIFRR